jgi:hypothetical protein
MDSKKYQSYGSQSNNSSKSKDSDLEPYFKRASNDHSSSSYSKTSSSNKKPGTCYMYERPDGSKHYDYAANNKDNDSKKSGKK